MSCDTSLDLRITGVWPGGTSVHEWFLLETTWTDENLVREARQRLAALKYTGENEVKQNDIHFIIDDSATYNSWSNFLSKEADRILVQEMQ